MSSSRNTKMLKDECHNHTLKLVCLDKKADIRSCVACTQGIIDNSYYNCPQDGCNYFMHKFCGELPLQMKHGFHQAHPLRLATNPPTTRICDFCDKGSKGYYYNCKECNFDIDLICATAAERQLEHYGHPHTLTRLRTSILAYCFCCGKEHGGVFYQCLKCVMFWIHEDCASLGLDVNAPNHPHPLHFVFSGQRYGSIRCEICYKKVDNNRSWYLQCVPCDFFSHVHCAMQDEKNEDIEEIDSEIPRLPWEDCDGEFGVVGLLNRKIATNDGEVEKEMKMLPQILRRFYLFFEKLNLSHINKFNSTVFSRNLVKTEPDFRMSIFERTSLKFGTEVVNHFSHPEHELILHAEVPKVEDPYHGHPIPLTTQCNGCTRKISSPFYSCLDCDFFLHKCCALLPTSIPQHPFHQQHRHLNLVQSTKAWCVEEVFKCDCCREYCNGFCFECEEESCEYKVDVECAFLPTSIVHKAHPFHPLTLTKHSYTNRMAGCCGLYISWSVGYECRKCEFRIHIGCAMYPGKASHRYDHENPFKLWYDRGAVEANYFYCERCEESINPKTWYYHSKTSIGDQLMHPNCILQREHPVFLKFKSTKNFLQVDIHPHRLHLSKTAYPYIYKDGFSKLCGYCKNGFKKIIKGDEKVEDLILSYNCWEPDCKFRIHYPCWKKLRGRDSTSAEEYDESS